MEQSNDKILVKRKTHFGSIDDYLIFNTKLSSDELVEVFRSKITAKITKFRDKNPTATNIKIDIDQFYDHINFELIWEEEETDSEYRARIKKLEHDKAKQKEKEAAEYAEYLRLKDKFECQK